MHPVTVNSTVYSNWNGSSWNICTRYMYMINSEMTLSHSWAAYLEPQLHHRHRNHGSLPLAPEVSRQDLLYCCCVHINIYIYICKSRGFFFSLHLHNWCEGPWLPVPIFVCVCMYVCIHTVCVCMYVYKHSCCSIQWSKYTLPQ